MVSPQSRRISQYMLSHQLTAIPKTPSTIPTKIDPWVRLVLHINANCQTFISDLIRGRLVIAIILHLILISDIRPLNPEYT